MVAEILQRNPLNDSLPVFICRMIRTGRLTAMTQVCACAIEQWAHGPL